MSSVVVNGAERRLEAGMTVAGIVTRLGRDPEARGIAVAINGEVVPRSRWTQRALQDGDRIEVLTATQGG